MCLIKQEIITSGSTSIDLTAADVNADGVVDIKDAIEVQDFLLCRTKGFTGSIRRSIDELDRSIVTKDINGNTLSGDETKLTGDMATLAETLGTPAGVFKYVLNNYKTEFYYGSRKGAIGTYEECGGNDYDQASLLIALLKYLGYTAYYAVGEVVFTNEDIINMTAASDIESAKKIFTAHGKTLTPYESGGYLTEQAMVYFVMDDTQMFLDPSFKYYSLKSDACDLEEMMKKLNSQYNLADSTLDLYDVSKRIESEYGTVDTIEAFQRYEIVQQDINDTMSYDVPSGKVATYETTLPNAMSDMVTISIGGTEIYQKKSCNIYGKDVTIEYEFTEQAAIEMDAYFGFDSIDDLTGNLGTYTNRAQIHGVLKVDGDTVAYNGKSNLLGEKEMLQIDVTTAGNTTTFEKELTVGALYSIVFDYQIISPYEIADGYTKLPQTSADQTKLNESNVYGSRTMMNTLTLLGKTYFSQVDTNNAILANFSDMRYERGLSVAIVDFTPHISNQNGSSPRLYKEGKIGIDVLGNWTLFNSLNGDSEEEEKIRHTAGYLSSFYEGETIKQFTSMQTVSTAEVLDQAVEQDINILYLSKSNIEALEASSLSAQNKADITTLLNEGKYVTVPSTEITIESWSGTGYIVHDPVTGENTYIINTNLNGGSICSWVGLASLCDIIASVVECTWAFDLVMLGATIFGTGLVILTGGVGLAAIAITAVGFGLIVGGAFYIKNIGDRLYESTELMNMYLDGNEDAGNALMKKGYWHLGLTVAFQGASHLVKPISNAFAKSKLGTSFFNLKPIVAAKELGYNISSACGRYLMNGFANSSYGILGALDLLNAISPKYAGMLCDFLSMYGVAGAETIAKHYQNGDVEGVVGFLDDPSTIPDLSRKAVKHPMNDHILSRYANQVEHIGQTNAEIYLSNNTFFNKSWTDEQVIAALNYGYKEAVSIGFQHGRYTFSYMGEKVTIYI